MRHLPAEGDHVTVVYLAAREAGTIERVFEHGSAVTVVTEGGDVLEFRLTATAQFITADRSARLVLEG